MWPSGGIVFSIKIDEKMIREMIRMAVWPSGQIVFSIKIDEKMIRKSYLQFCIKIYQKSTPQKIEITDFRRFRSTHEALKDIGRWQNFSRQGVAKIVEFGDHF